MASDDQHDHLLQPKLADRVVRTTFEAYKKLPKHGKPITRTNGVPEWTILASISVVISSEPDPKISLDAGYAQQEKQVEQDAHGSERIVSVALGSGVKVLPFVKLPPAGDTVHDCHAEVLARRGFCRWMLHQATSIAKEHPHAGVLEWIPATQKFSLKPGVQLWLYVSALPCGDASTLHTAAFQPTEMAALKSASESSPLNETGQSTSRGRNGYSSFGALRTKPGRTDSPPTISMSCSDKIAFWSVLGLQGALLSDLFEPIYLDHIVIGGALEPPLHMSDGQGVDRGDWREAMLREAERACFGRLADLDGRLPSPFGLHRPSIHLTSVEFAYSKSSMTSDMDGAVEPVTSPKCLLGVRDMVPEILFNGARQGVVWRPPGLVAIVEKARSAVCKLELLRSFLALREAIRAANDPESRGSSKETLHDLKHTSRGGVAYQAAKRLLRGVPVPGEGVVTGAFERCNGVMVTSIAPLGDDEAEPPFAGWLVSGEPFEGFNRDGNVVG